MRQHRAIGTPIELYKALAKDAAFPLPVAISSDSVDTEVVYSHKHAEQVFQLQGEQMMIAQTQKDRSNA